MSHSTYRTAPQQLETMPPGIPFIVGNEAAERFSFYGMRAILAVFLTKHLLDSSGALAPLDEHRANEWQHNFVAASYFFPIIGAIISDAFLGKYNTILSLSLLYCLGHAVMALVDYPAMTGIHPQTMLIVALSLIAMGAGGIKPCVSSHVGDQFGPNNKHLLPKVFGWFYFSINFGSAISTILTPLLLQMYGPGVAFGVPGVLMGIATFVFWLGRNKFVHIPAGGWGFVKETFSAEGLRAIFGLLPLFILLSPFWSLFDQTQSTWVHQAAKMDRTIFGYTLEPSQVQALNPILVMMLIPLYSYVIIPAVSKFVTVTPLRKIGFGLLMTAPAFAIVAFAQERIDAGGSPHLAWQACAYLVMTMAEVLVSITGLEFSYTQAPRKMKSIVMSVYLLSVALGNKFTAGVNQYIANEKEKGNVVLDGASYFWFFTAVMLITAVIFVIYSQFYRGRVYIQGDDEVAGH